MEQRHRNAINRNLLKLISVENFDKLFDEIAKRNVFPEDYIQDLTVDCSNHHSNGCCHMRGTKMKQQFFLDIQKRGPTAFNKLVEALEVNNNAHLATLLQNDENRIQDDRSETPANEDKNDEVSDEVDYATRRPRLQSSLHASENLGDLSKIPYTKRVNNSYPNPPPQPQMQKATLYNNGDSTGRCYTMKSNPRGLALVINIIHFMDPSKERRGAKHDTRNLTRLFEELNFETTIVSDPDKEDLVGKDGVIQKFIEKFDEKEVDSCMVVIMSHGEKDNQIETSDGEFVNAYDDILYKFDNTNFSAFIEKPKVFLFQVCRGGKENYFLTKPTNLKDPKVKRMRTAYDGPRGDGERALGGLSNAIILNSTIPGFSSMRDEERGTIFIESVCGIFRTHAFNTHLEIMTNLIDEEMKKKHDVDDRGKKIGQTVHSEKMHPFYQLYFNPGLL